MLEICRPKRQKEEKLTYKTNTKRVVAAGGEVLWVCVQMCVQKQSCRPKFNLTPACLDLPIEAGWAGDSLICLQDLDQLNESSPPSHLRILRHNPSLPPYLPCPFIGAFSSLVSQRLSNAILRLGAVCRLVGCLCPGLVHLFALCSPQ